MGNVVSTNTGTSPVQEAPAATTTSSDKPFRFLDLPIEIRLYIYEQLVVVGKIFYTPSQLEKQEGSRFLEMDDYAAPELTMLRVNKQIYDEAEPVYLSKNLFVLPLGAHLKQPFVSADEVGRNDRPLFSIRGLRFVQNISLAFVSFQSQPYVHMASDWGTHGNPDYTDFVDTQARWEHIHQMADLRMSLVLDDIFVALNTQLESTYRYLEMDFTNAFCPIGCCRLLEEACNLTPIETDQSRPEAIALLGLRSEEEEKVVIENLKSTLDFYWEQERRYNEEENRPTPSPRFLIRGNGEPWAAYKINSPPTSDEKYATIDQSGEEATAVSSDETESETVDATADAAGV
jgi:hypothetical protein